MMTQIEAARRGEITPEMEYVARREGLDPVEVRDEVARGRMVIPANGEHLALRLEPMGIGIKAKCKINANIGNSAVTSDVDNELAKLAAGRRARRRHRDGPLHRRQHRRDPPRPSSPPAPCRSAPCRCTRRSRRSSQVEDLTEQDLLDMVEHQARQGVDYMTLHAGILRDHIPLTAHRVTGSSRGAAR